MNTRDVATQTDQQDELSYKSAFTGSAVGSLSLLLYIGSYVNAAPALVFTIGITVLDYKVRNLTGNVGLFDGMFNWYERRYREEIDEITNIRCFNNNPSREQRERERENGFRHEGELPRYRS